MKLRLLCIFQGHLKNKESDTTATLTSLPPPPQEVCVCARERLAGGTRGNLIPFYTFIIQKCFLTAGEENIRAYKKLNYHTV